MKLPVRASRALTALSVALLLFVSSCKKDKDPDTGSAATAMAADGGGFKDVLSADYLTDYNGSFRVPDFTVEGNKLHIVYATSLVSQQGSRYKLFRRTVDLNTGAVIAQPAGADTLLEAYNLSSSEYRRGPALFLPYRNFFTCSKFRQNGLAPESYFGGDLLLTDARASGGYFPDLGFRYPVNNSSEGSVTWGADPASPSYQLKSFQPHLVSHATSLTQSTYYVVLESFRHSFQDSIFSIDVRADSIIAYTLAPDASGKIVNVHKVAAIASFSSKPGYNGVERTIIRHYDPSGNKLAVAIIGDKRACTYTFDFTTRTLTRGLDNFTMPHTDPDNIDLDEEGSLYYADKMAGFGATTVYRRTVAGATSVVGAEKPLRYGEIVRVKYLLGKVYIAASGLPSGVKETHLAVLQQQ